MQKIMTSLLLCSGMLTMVACGSGSSDHNDDPPQPTTKTYTQISGTAFAENPLKNANIQAICKNDSGFKTPVQTNELGEWKGQIEADQMPCRLAVNAGRKNYYSYIHQGTQVNINPFTDMIIAIASAQLPSIWYKTGKDLNNNQLATATQSFQKAMQEKHYDLDIKTNIFTESIKLNDNVHSNIQSLFSSLDKQVILKDYDALLLLIKDGNLNQIPAKITLVPTFYGQTVNLSTCSHNANFPTFYTNCSSSLLQDFEITNLVDTQNGEKCILKKQTDVITLMKSNAQVKTLLSDKDIPPNRLSLGDGYKLSIQNTNFSLEWGKQILKEFSLDLEVSDQGQLISVSGKSNEPKQEFTCVPQ